jgi:CheY-like chemotaxis protein
METPSHTIRRTSILGAAGAAITGTATIGTATIGTPDMKADMKADMAADMEADTAVGADMGAAADTLPGFARWRYSPHGSRIQIAKHTACLISDIRMPGMSGIEMHESLRAQGHAPATIFISAYPTPSLQAKAVSNGALVLLQKPYQPSVMTHWLSVALGDP